MYTEERESISLMQLNAYYRDKRYSNKIWMMLFDLKKYISDFRDFILLPFCIGKKDMRQIKLQARAYLKPSLIYDHKQQYNFSHNEEIPYKTTGKIIKTKVVVYTSIFGDYDPLIDPLYKSENCEYYAITDQDIPINSVWKKYDTSSIDGFEKMDDYHKSKFCKMHPHILFPGYDFSIWVDGNVQIVADLYPLVDRINDKHCIAAFQNPFHDCIYTETRYNICQNNVSIDGLLNQVEGYRQEGFPMHFGMRELTIIVREHNNKHCIDIMNDWWEQVNLFTMRDQISLPYVIWKNNLAIDYIQLLGDNWKWNPRFLWYPHNWHISFDRDGEKNN